MAVSRGILGESPIRSGRKDSTTEPQAGYSPGGEASPSTGVRIWHDCPIRATANGLGKNWYDVGRVAQAIVAFRLRTQGLDGGAEPEPSGSIETTLVNIWRKVLGRTGIGLNVNFFEVGGTSLKAVQVVTMIRKELNHSLSIVSLFECPTIALLAARLRGSSSSEFASSGAVSARPAKASQARGRTRSR